MKNLSTLISEAIINTFAELKQNTYEGYENDFWYVIRGCTGEVFIGLKTQNERVNKYLEKELGWYLSAETEEWLGIVHVVFGECSEYMGNLQEFLNGECTEVR